MVCLPLLELIRGHLNSDLSFHTKIRVALYEYISVVIFDLAFFL